MEKTQNEKSNSSSADYDRLYKESIDTSTMEEFWGKESTEISWFSTPSKIGDSSKAPFYNWFIDGKLNMCYNCLDRHIENNNGDVRALIMESGYSNKVETYSYNELFVEVNKLSKILLDQGIQTGDRVIIYMPMMCESIVAMMACWRIGAIHSVVFGGFAPAELADRINDAKPKMLITASAGIEPRKKINYFKNISDSYNSCKYAGENKVTILLFQRKDVLVITNEEITTFTSSTKTGHHNVGIYDEEMVKLSKDTFVKPVAVLSSHPGYILYTSGTTGSPKGIVRDTGGCAVTANFTMKNIMNINKGDISFSSSDIGWVVGHLFIVYGPLGRCATSMIFEGKPVGTPNCEKCFQLIEKYKVKTFYTCPTVIRAIRREDPEGKLISKYDGSSLESLELSGERCDPESFIWIQKIIGEDKLINDHWWQTESGYIICCNNINIHRFKSKPGTPGKPMLGFNVKIIDTTTLQVGSQEGDSCKNTKTIEITEPNKNGMICIKLPSPPSFIQTLWNNDQAFLEKYISKDRQYYITEDIGCFDEDGNVTILSRMDDMIKIAGHRLTTGRMEEVILSVPQVIEVAVVSVNDEGKGELPFAFCVYKKDIKEEEAVKISESVKTCVAANIGAISRLKGVCVCHQGPKTRSGKIIRNGLKSGINNEKYVIPATIEDPSVISEIAKNLKKDKYIA